MWIQSKINKSNYQAPRNNKIRSTILDRMRQWNLIRYLKYLHNNKYGELQAVNTEYC